MATAGRVGGGGTADVKQGAVRQPETRVVARRQRSKAGGTKGGGSSAGAQ